jgi:S-formylglutathione hydrolase
MYSYITDELPTALFAHFKELDGSKVSITGHSMGGHGALTLVGFSLFCLHYPRFFSISLFPFTNNDGSYTVPQEPREI